jgi:hypothetical protein
MERVARRCIPPSSKQTQPTFSANYKKMIKATSGGGDAITVQQVNKINKCVAFMQIKNDVNIEKFFCN